MPDARLPQRAPRHRDDVVRGEAGRLVDDEPAVWTVRTGGPSSSYDRRRVGVGAGAGRHGRRHGGQQRGARRRRSRLRSRNPTRSCGRRRRTAWRPPRRRSSPFDRRLTRNSAGPSSLKNADARISFTVSGRLMRPSVSSYVPPARATMASSTRISARRPLCSSSIALSTAPNSRSRPERIAVEHGARDARRFDAGLDERAADVERARPRSRSSGTIRCPSGCRRRCASRSSGVSGTPSATIRSYTISAHAAADASNQLSAP